MRVRNWEDFVEFDSEGRLVDTSRNYRSHLEARTAEFAAQGGLVATHANVGTLDGSFGSETEDVVAINLIAGQTYTFALRGTPTDGIEDPYLAIFGPGFSYITEDDDGGQGRSSQITITAESSGTYYLYATSWYHIDPSAPGYPDYRDSGDYTINIWSPDPAHDAPNSLATTFELNLGTNYGYIDFSDDVDVYKVQVTEGNVYAFSYSGGVSGGADFDGEPGENVVYVDLLDANGNLLGSNLNYESSLSFFAEESGTVFVRVRPFYGTGGYTIDVEQIDPLTRDPLESLNWDSAENIPTVDVDGVPTAYVYFAPAGENFGELADDDVSPMTTFGWTDAQRTAVMHALQTHYTPITGINYVVTTDVDQATFRLLTTESTQYGAYFYPQAPNYGDGAGIGVFNLRSGGFGSDPNSLLPGGYSYAVVLHEFGHAHGVAHPHDTGGGSEVMLGVTASTGSLGVYDLNQGVYTVMSYNDGWITHPDGELAYSAATRGSGWSETLGAFDIAVLQARYGVHNNNDGDTVYTLADVQGDASYQTIWDTSGNDTIAYNGERNVQIDLLAATLDYTPTGGGVLSYASGIYGGYTIANGVVIENASGGSGNDVILGNASANILNGRNGDDYLMGREGSDTLNGGNGIDELDGGEGNDVLNGDKGDDVLVGGSGDDTLNGGNGNDVLIGGTGNDRLNGGRGSDLYVFTDAGTDTIVGYEGGEKIDLSGLGVTSSAVTITRTGIVVELGAEDLTILFNTRGFSASDIIYAPPAEMSSSMSAESQAYMQDAYLF